MPLSDALHRLSIHTDRTTLAQNARLGIQRARNSTRYVCTLATTRFGAFVCSGSSLRQCSRDGLRPRRDKTGENVGVQARGTTYHGMIWLTCTRLRSGFRSEGITASQLGSSYTLCQVYKTIEMIINQGPASCVLSHFCIAGV